MKRAKPKPKKKNPVLQLRRDLTEHKKLNRTQAIALENEKKWRELDKALLKANNESVTREKDRYYAEANAYRARVARLEKAVTSLKNGMQNTLLAFDTLA